MSDLRLAPTSRSHAGPIVITRFTPLAIGRDMVLGLYEESAPRFAAMDELVAKAYLLSADGSTGGAVYVWRGGADPEGVFDEPWRARVRQRYGVEPTVEVFESPLRIGTLADAPRSTDGGPS